MAHAATDRVCGNCAHWNHAAGLGVYEPAPFGKRRLVVYGRCENQNVSLLDMRDALALTNADANCDDCGEGFSPSDKFTRVQAQERYCEHLPVDSPRDRKGGFPAW